MYLLIAFAVRNPRFPLLSNFISHGESLSPRYWIIVTHTILENTSRRLISSLNGDTLLLRFPFFPELFVVLLILPDQTEGIEDRSSGMKNGKESSARGGKWRKEGRFTSSLRSTLSGWLSLSSVVPLLTLEFSSTYVQRIFNRIPLYCTILVSPLCHFSFSYFLLRLLFRCFFLFLLVGFVGRLPKICGGSESDWNRETARLEQRERWRMISFAG